MRREDENPQPPKGLVEKDRQNFIRHFNERSLAETRAFITKDSFEDKCNVRIELIQSNQLNTPKVAELVEKFAADCCFIFGADLIRSPLFEALPKTKINLHLGLSPWYRGAATLFWPFYFLAPQLRRDLYHIDEKPDSGNIVQCCPILEPADGIHDVGVKAVIQAKKDVRLIFEKFKENGGRRKTKNFGKLA